jgi:spore coat polysaccharide biosynthesis protein SpsF (cytidylyltransferase family)
LRKTWSSRHRRLRTPDRKRIEHPHIIVKTLKIQNKERILKVAREKHQATYKGKPIRITADFSTENLRAKKAMNDVFQILKENNCKHRLLNPENYHS